ncbi:CAP domain-containing protein [Hoeflea sp. AS60]|uniref:CAP domain-containing protein n=1 Tax=Hoeflea sp. AS60 TaxID=3135780 RepID=UPI003175F460
MILRLTFLLALMLMPAAASAQTVDNIQALRERSLALVNEERRAEGLKRLELEDDLNEAALAHAEDMLDRNYFAHTSPEGGTVLDRYMKAGGDQGRVVRENLSSCKGCLSQPNIADIEQMHEGWMNSPGHRANILAEGLTNFGFAVVHNSDGNRYGVQTFAGPGTPRGELPEGSVQTIGPEAQMQLAAEIINALRSDANAASADNRLRRHVEGKLPSGNLADDSLSKISLLNDLPADFPWLNYQVLSGQCGGCGENPTNSDVYFFLNSWSDSGRPRAILKDTSLTNIGFAIVADGQGRKLAVLLLAGE